METFIIIGAIIFSAFFSGMEIAFVSANRLQIEIELSKGKFPAGLIRIFARDPGKYIATMLVGNNIALVIYGLAMARVLEPWVASYISSEFWILITQTIISTLIILLFAEFIPKSLFRANPNITLNLFSPLVFVFYVIFYPITILTIAISNFFMKHVLHHDVSEQNAKQIFGRADLDHFITQLQQFEDQTEFEQEIKYIKNTLDFNAVKVRECIVPRNELVAMPIESTLEEIRAKMAETGHSKVLIYKDNIDNIIGYVHSLSLFHNPKSLDEILVKIPIVPETMSAKKLLDLLMKENKSIALVVDEYGGTSGIVTIEDILEEIFGEIRDEHDLDEQMLEQKISDNEFVFSARLEIDYINDKYNIDLPVSEDYETLAGLAYSFLETIPRQGDSFTIDDKYQIIIEQVNAPRIEKIRLKILDRD